MHTAAADHRKAEYLAFLAPLGYCIGFSNIRLKVLPVRGVKCFLEGGFFE